MKMLISDKNPKQGNQPEPESQIQPETENQTKTDTSDEPDFDQITHEFGESDPDPEPAALEGGEPASGLLSRDQFFVAFKSMFNVAAVVPVPPLPLTSLAISPNDEMAARGASDALYDIALESTYFRWLIEPQSVWVQRAVVIGSFASVKFVAVREEIRAKNARPVNDPPKQEKSRAQAADEAEIIINIEAMKGVVDG